MIKDKIIQNPKNYCLFDACKIYLNGVLLEYSYKNTMMIAKHYESFKNNKYDIFMISDDHFYKDNRILYYLELDVDFDEFISKEDDSIEFDKYLNSKGIEIGGGVEFD